MSEKYMRVKTAVIEVVDDFSDYAVAANYAPRGKKTYTAKTELITLHINAPVLAIMPIRFNKALNAACAGEWRDVGTLDLVDQATIGDLIRLACGQSGTSMPVGEPA